MRKFLHPFARSSSILQAPRTQRRFIMNAFDSTPANHIKSANDGTSKTIYSTSDVPDESPDSTPPYTGEAHLPKAPLALPEAPYNPSKVHELDMSSGNASIALDHLGPMVVNADGTLARISNWEKMADIEKKNTLRIIGKRNQDRLKVLREREAEKKAAGVGNS